MQTHGDTTAPPPSPSSSDPGAAVAVQRAFAHRHEVVHLIYAAADEADATRRLAALLEVDQATVATVLDQPLRNMLPEHRAELATRPARDSPAG
jgi:hypothetical protein